MPVLQKLKIWECLLQMSFPIKVFSEIISVSFTLAKDKILLFHSYTYISFLNPDNHPSATAPSNFKYYYNS